VSARAELGLARRLAREAARTSKRALVRVTWARSVRSRLESGARHGGLRGGAAELAPARTVAVRSLLASVHVEGPLGVGCADESIGESELSAPRPRLVARALAAARVARNGGSLAGALEGEEPRRRPVDGRVPETAATEIFGAVLRGARSGNRGSVSLVLDTTVESERVSLACSGEGGERALAISCAGAVVEGELEVEDARGGPLASALVAFAGELASRADATRLRAEARAAGREAARSALARSEPVSLGRPARIALAPEAVAWIVGAPLAEGFALARSGERAPCPGWLEVDDDGADGRDEQGRLAAPFALVRAGAWVRGPFRAFDGSGRTRRDPRTRVPRAELASLALRPRARVLPRRRLVARAQLVLSAVESMDPLPAGGVLLVARAERRIAGAWHPAGLVAARLDAGELLARTLAASSELEAVETDRLPVLAPWLLARLSHLDAV
jgi:hypothetical protein